MSADASVVHVAVDTAILASETLKARLWDDPDNPDTARIFTEIAPENTKLPYIRYGSTGEQSRNAFASAGGSRGDKVIDIFGENKMQVLEIYELLHTTLHRVRLPLPGEVEGSDRYCTGDLSLVGTIPDEGVGAHAVVRYTPRVK